MKNEYLHKIAENSAYFQGHKEQFFSKNKHSFRIKSNYGDRDKIEEFNVEKYRKLFCRKINELIAKRNSSGGNLMHIKKDDLMLIATKFSDSFNDDFECGRYEIYPKSALCKANNCNSYFELGKKRSCGHKKDDPWEQLSFAAFCDKCGRLLPLHYMTNITKDCKKCKSKNSLIKLSWTRRDEISTYRISCKECKNKVGLFFFECDHTIRSSNTILSTLPKNRFRGIPVRMGSVLHPFVVTMPDIPQEDEINKSGRKTLQGKFLSEAFEIFFENSQTEIRESLIYLPEFREDLTKNEPFWKTKNIQDTCDLFDLEISKITEWSNEDFLNIIKTNITDAVTRASKGIDIEKIKEVYSINEIFKTLDAIKDLSFDELDLQGIFLLNSSSDNPTNINIPYKKNEPSNKPENYNEILNTYGLNKILHITNLNMIQALLGIIEGSSRNIPLLFRTITMGKKKRPTVFMRNFKTEGIVFQLNYKLVLRWLNNNGISDLDVEKFESKTNDEIEKIYRKRIINDSESREAVITLLHTYSHMLIQQSSVDTGLDLRSLSEILYPMNASIFIYSTNSINTGGLEFTFDYHIVDWLQRIYDLASDCPQDPACILDENGSCNACSFVPEFVCCDFNNNLDRSSLIGNTSRFERGYFNENKSKY